MSDPAGYLWLIPLLPLAASAITALLGPRFLKHSSHIPCIVAVAGSCVLSVMVFLNIYQNGGVVEAPYYAWVSAGDAYLPITLRADALTSIMLVMVTFIGSLIAIYAVGYMHHDPGYARFFAEVALFVASMTGLVLASNFILLYACWEGVGVCSYLLIGFWFQKPEAAKAARKAFLVTRLGDIGFLIGILVIWSQFTIHGAPIYTLDYTQVFRAVSDPYFEGPVALACLLLFCGAVGKSAQFPLHVWLPDAMEGPTPVSALIHAATMVTAGVYMVARCTPLFQLAPDVQLLVAVIGGITALLAAIIALTQNDLKRVLAYSTLSQLGYMFMALGSATLAESGHGEGLVVIGVTAGMFHLFTHAFFKALLFMAAGSVMHSMGNVIDMRRFGGLRYALKTTHWTFLCGALALSGFPLFAGFWSKDLILGALVGASTAEGSYKAIYAMLFAVALITAGLTAFYTFRAYFLTFWGEYRVPSEAGEHVHESPPVMTVPLMILAMGAIGVGYFNAEPMTDSFQSFLEGTPFIGSGHAEEAGGLNIPVMLGGTLFALGGIAIAAWMYVIRPGLAARLAGSIPGLYQLSLNKFYIDEIYSFFIVKPLNGIAELARLFDLYGVDSLVDVLGQVPRFVGLFFRPIQNGLAQFYALAMALGLTAFLVALLWNFVW
jgi:NADH-quinone oxidoreductase subunit L